MEETDPAAAAPAAEAKNSEGADDESSGEGEEQAENNFISLEAFPYSVGDVVTGRVLFSNERGARVALHGIKGVLGYVLFSHHSSTAILALSVFLSHVPRAQ